MNPGTPTTPRVLSAPGRENARTTAPDPRVTKAGNNRFTLILILLTFTLAVVTLLSLAIGAVRIPPSAILQAIAGHSTLTAAQRTILLEVRLPRVLASGIVGAALAVSGLLFQGLFRNPMADPYVIGSSGGALLGACIGIFFFSQLSLFGFSAVALLAFAGSVATIAVVYMLARSHSQTNPVALLLAGFAVSTMLSYASFIFELFGTNASSATTVLLAWMRGVIGIPEWRQLALASLLLAIALIAAIPLTHRLNTLALGEEYAHQLGLHVERTRFGIIVIGSLLAAVAVALGGLISFAGLIIPHIGRLLLGPDHTRLLPVTALAGAIFLMLADTLARSLFAPTELPVGILMAFIGGPFFLYLLRHANKGYTL